MKEVQSLWFPLVVRGSSEDWQMTATTRKLQCGGCVGGGDDL